MPINETGTEIQIDSPTIKQSQRLVKISQSNHQTVQFHRLNRDITSTYININIVICAEFRSSNRGLLPLIRHSRNPRRPPNLSNSTFRVYTSRPTLLPSPKPYKRPYSLGIYTYHTHQTILVSTKPTTVIKQFRSRAHVGGPTFQAIL